MGYYTWIGEVEIFKEGKPISHELRLVVINHVNLSVDATYEWKEGLVSVLCGESDDFKYYGLNDDFRKLSKEFPKYVFKFHADGEESEDKSYRYFHDGKEQKTYVEFVYPPILDWSQLKAGEIIDQNNF
ncbi:hypothetical protein ACFL4H_00245 [Candidatus Neomarinimicrobiota bacterium]